MLQRSVSAMLIPTQGLNLGFRFHSMRKSYQSDSKSQCRKVAPPLGASSRVETTSCLKQPATPRSQFCGSRVWGSELCYVSLKPAGVRVLRELCGCPMNTRTGAAYYIVDAQET